MSLDLDGLDRPLASATGAPLLLPVDSIDEDPEQPRKEFDAQALRELAETIKERGVRQPISVRPHPQRPGRWMLNFGARRLRASVLATCASIPAFVDETADSYDQVIENEQRQPLKPLELALFVQRRLAAGESQAEIARRMGKSRQYVMIATALIDAPDWLMDAYRSGRCRGMNELHELRRLHAERPQHIESWAAEQDGITRERLQALRAELGNAAPTGTVPLAQAAADAARRGPDDGAPAAETSDQIALGPQPRRGRRLLARFDDRVVAIVIESVPSSPGRVFVEAGKALRREVEADQLTLLGFGEL
jgi:ParB family chromosome partitioning protein